MSPVLALRRCWGWDYCKQEGGNTGADQWQWSKRSGEEKMTCLAKGDQGLGAWGGFKVETGSNNCSFTALQINGSYLFVTQEKTKIEWENKKPANLKVETKTLLLLKILLTPLFLYISCSLLFLLWISINELTYNQTFEWCFCVYNVLWHNISRTWQGCHPWWLKRH